MQIREFRQTERLIVYTLDAAAALADLGGGRRICCLFDLTGNLICHPSQRVRIAFRTDAEES